MKAIFAAAALLLAAACSDASGPAGAVQVRTDASAYRLPGGPGSVMTIHVTVRNTGSEPIAVANCGVGVGAIADRREGGAWVEMDSCLHLPVFVPPRVLAPGDVAEGEVSVSEAGRYRIRLPVHVGPEEGGESSNAVSPDFVVHWMVF